jgi:hypothetical protein
MAYHSLTLGRQQNTPVAFSFEALVAVEGAGIVLAGRRAVLGGRALADVALVERDTPRALGFEAGVAVEGAGVVLASGSAVGDGRAGSGVAGRVVHQDTLPMHEIQTRKQQEAYPGALRLVRVIAGERARSVGADRIAVGHRRALGGVTRCGGCIGSAGLSQSKGSRERKNDGLEKHLVL